MAGARVPVELARIIINEQSPHQTIVLREKGGGRQLDIDIGMFEAWAIESRVKDKVSARPMTHDLLAGAIRELGGELRAVVITDLQGGTFFAELHVAQGKKEHRIDCRPSDAVALAVRLEVPVFIEADVFAKLAAGE